MHFNKNRKHTEQTKKNMSNAHKGKTFTESHKKALSDSHKGKNYKSREKTNYKDIHHKAYQWVLISPTNELFRTYTISSFCKDNNLSYSVLRYKAQNNDGTPVIRGPSKGWIVFGVSKKPKLI